RERNFYRGLQAWLANELDTGTLSADERADLAIIGDQIELALLELDRIQSYKHNPTLYVELLGAALFDPYVREYAPKPQRYGHIVARLEKAPALFGQAKANLVDAPEIWTMVARQENDGTISLIDGPLREGAPEELRDDYDKAAETALAALRSFNEFLDNDLAKRISDWRLGAEHYAPKFRYVLATDSTPEQVLADAEAEMKAVRDEMLKIAGPLHEKWFPEDESSELNTVVAAVLGKIAEKHATPETYFDDAKRDLAEATDFVRTKRLLPLPGRDNLEVIPTPEFMRGIYSVGGFNPAPALEPELGAYYWLTPIPADWPPERIASKLREYNYYGLKLLTIHEAMPGHYVQFEYANSIEPQTRRLIRGVFGNGPYIEGWGIYSTEMLLDEGYLDNSPELRLTFLKQQLRMIANAILDVRMQTMGMTDEDAMSLMLDRAFQEQEEAEGKLRRAKLSSCQLPTYYVGWRDWHRLRRQYRAHKGEGFQLAEFHETTLNAGAVPVPVLAKLLMREALKP
ncbi:MAG: DUF885 domain-containing protein, partial [bacterium]|nr:DUF885 domain-containing protein [bacterium]